jgi:hypothetical protein
MLEPLKTSTRASDAIASYWREHNARKQKTRGSE